jgi:hypothetical protein
MFFSHLVWKVEENQYFWHIYYELNKLEKVWKLEWYIQYYLFSILIYTFSFYVSNVYKFTYLLQAGNVEGQVVDMGLTTTSLLNAEKFPVIVPNSLFSSQVGPLSITFFPPLLSSFSATYQLHHQQTIHAQADIILKSINRTNL